MLSKDRRSHRIPNSARLPKVKTINDLLTRDDINGILTDLDSKKPDITDMVVVYYDSKSNRLGYQVTNDTLISIATWMMEATKLDLLNEDKED